MKRFFAGLLACALALSTAVSASADGGKITTQPYMSILPIKELRAQGYEGAGVKVALIDGRVDTSVPELAGADITNKQFCSGKSEPSEVGHATSLLMMLASPDFGWVPKAKFTVYESPHGLGGDGGNLPEDCRKVGNDLMLQEALNDHNDLVVIAQGAVMGEGSAYPIAVARATEMGVPVVVAAGNDSRSSLRDMAAKNGVVAVGAASLNGVALPLSNTGQGLTIMAPGEKTTIRDPDASGKLTGRREVDGTSVAVPHVGGMLAMAKGKWPKANGNQLIRAMLATVINESGTKYSTKFGFGNMDAKELLGFDPMSQPTSNPLMDKNPGGRPTPQEVADYRDGLLEHILVAGDKEYVYRGDNKLMAEDFPPSQRQPGTSPRFKASEYPSSSSAVRENNLTNSGSSSTAWWWPVGIIAICLIVAAAGTGIWFLVRRSR